MFLNIRVALSFDSTFFAMPIQRIRNTFVQLGALDGSLYFVDRILQAISGQRARLIRYYLVAQPVASRPTCRPSAKTPVTLLAPSDPIVALFPRPPEVISRRLREGSSCLVARSGDTFAGFLWLAYEAYDEDEVRCRYELVDSQRCVWDYDVHVEPEYRLGRSFARLWDAANAHLAAEGIQWSISRISAFNPASLAAHGRLGIQKLGCATFFRFGSLQISILSEAPYLHLSLRSSSHPTLRIAPPASRT
jgi:hypothetical protein